MRIQRIWCCAAFITSVLGAPASAGPLRFGMDLNYPPFSWQSADGQPQGFDRDIAYALCKEMKVQCQIIPQDWDGLIQALNLNKYDAILSSMQITQTRMASVDFSHKYYQNSSRMIAAQGSSVTQRSFAHMRIGVLRASTQAAFAHDYWGRSGASIVEYDKITTAFDALRQHQLQAVFVDNLVGKSTFPHTAQGQGFAFVGPSYSDPRYFGYGAGIAVNKGNVQLLKKLNQAIDQLRRDGSYKQIENKYFDFDIYGK